jgi:hypothetical protein
MKRKIALGVVAVAALVLAAVPLVASADDDHREDEDHRLTIGVRLDFTSSTEAVGTFAACCKVNDAGNASATITSFTPRRSRAEFEATNTFDGSKGSITIRLRGTTGPLGSDRHVARGHWRIIDGSGSYENLRGRGRLTAVTDQTTGALTAIDEGEVSGVED